MSPLFKVTILEGKPEPGFKVQAEHVKFSDSFRKALTRSEASLDEKIKQGLLFWYKETPGNS